MTFFYFLSCAGAGFLEEVTLVTARPGYGDAAPWVEVCSCPVGYIGQFCESCAPGYRRENPKLGPYSPCVLCTCNGHSDTCDPETGKTEKSNFQKMVVISIMVL